MLLYERYLGRPFASQRDAVSELVGDVMESAIEEQLTHARVPFRKTKRAERVAGFEQAPDFFAPGEYAPAVVIEAKITGDDGTARDEVTRIRHLATMHDERAAKGESGWQLVACIDGRGFGVRKQDLRAPPTRPVVCGAGMSSSITLGSAAAAVAALALDDKAVTRPFYADEQMFALRRCGLMRGYSQGNLRPRRG